RPLGVVTRRVRLAAVPVDAGQLHGAREHGLAEGRAGQGGGVEAGKGMEGIALDPGALHRGIQERQVKGGVVPDQDRPAAAMRADRGSDLAEQALQGIGLVDGWSQRMPWIDARDLQRGGIEPRTFKWLHMVGMRRAAAYAAIRADFNDHSGDLE